MRPAAWMMAVGGALATSVCMPLSQTRRPSMPMTLRRESSTVPIGVVDESCQKVPELP